MPRDKLNSFISHLLICCARDAERLFTVACGGFMRWVHAVGKRYLGGCSLGKL